MRDEKVISVIVAIVYICLSIYGISYNDKQLCDMLLFLGCFAAVGTVIVIHSNNYIEQSRVYPVNQVFYI